MSGSQKQHPFLPRQACRRNALHLTLALRMDVHKSSVLLNTDGEVSRWLGEESKGGTFQNQGHGRVKQGQASSGSRARQGRAGRGRAGQS